MSIAKQIKEARRAARFSQMDLAKLIGVSDKSISSYEMGRVTPPVKILKSIANHTKKPLNYFIDENEINKDILFSFARIEKDLAEIKAIIFRIKP